MAKDIKVSAMALVMKEEAQHRSTSLGEVLGNVEKLLYGRVLGTDGKC